MANAPSASSNACRTPPSSLGRPRKGVRRIADWLTDPDHAVRIHAAFGLVWLLPGSVVTLVWLSNSVAFVAWMSLYAIVIGHWAGLQGAGRPARQARRGPIL